MFSTHANTLKKPVSIQEQCEWRSAKKNVDVEFQQTPAPLPAFLNKKPIGHITTTRYNVFTDDQSLSLNFLYQWLNRIHWVTQENVILEELSFTTNDLFDPVKIRESERLLRQQKFIYDARITPISLCNDKVNLAISTRDTWSLTPAFNISHNGDETKTRLSLTESNFLGTGKFISVARSSDNQRQGYTFIYHDPNVGGKHLINNIEYSDNSDGYKHYIAIKLPFYSLNSKVSYGMTYINEEREDPIYTGKEKLTSLTHQLNQYRIYGGFSNGYQDNKTIRWRYGINFIEDKFDITDPAIELLPLNSRINFYPWLEFNLLENNYTTLTNFNSIRRTEDINLGRNFRASIGYSPQQWSNDKSRLVYQVSSRNAFKFDNDLINIKGNINGYWLPKEKKSQNVTANITGQYYHFFAKDWVFYTGMSYNLIKNPYLENQLFLGGDNGLRGYPVRYQMGNRNTVINIEQRYYSDLYWWKLVRVGAAAYIDIARSWGEQSPLLTGASNANLDNRWLSNIGFGLRLAPSRADANHIIHIDLAFPLQQNDELDRARFIIQVKRSF